MGNFLNKKSTKYFTPLGIISLAFFLWTVIEIIRIALSENDPGFGGVIIIALGIVFIISFLLDRILSILFKKRTNIKIQSVIVLVFLIFLFYVLLF